MAHSALSTGKAEPFAARHLLIVVMILITAISQFGLTPKMVQLRTQMVDVDSIAPDDPRRVEFGKLHKLSERMEGAVLVLGVAVIALTARRLG